MSPMLAALLCLTPVAIDGDTLRCANLGRVRLIGIDAPETAGHCRKGRVCTPGDGMASKRTLARLIKGRAVTCQDGGRDRYGRVLGRCYAGGVDLSCAMVSAGQAVYRYSSIRCERMPWPKSSKRSAPLLIG